VRPGIFRLASSREQLEGLPYSQNLQAKPFSFHNFAQMANLDSEVSVLGSENLRKSRFAVLPVRGAQLLSVSRVKYPDLLTAERKS
jgi:hypothetical protein